MPSLNSMNLTEKAFYYKNNITLKGSPHFILLSRLDIGALASIPGFPKHNPNANVCSLDDLLTLDSDVTEVIFNYRPLNSPSFTVLDLSRFKSVRRIVIGDESFMYVNEVNMTRLSQLESVEIGMNSFTQHKNSSGNDPNRHFYLKNCPKLKSLKMGRFSFSDYTVCEIENVDALEMIEMGELNEESTNFLFASLELKSILIHSE